MLLAVARAAAFALASVGGGLYEFLVVDPFWPKRPDLIQPARGGISRKRFWISIHVAFEKADPDAVSESKAVAWTRRSRLRLSLDLITCGGMLTAFAAAARLG